MIREVRETRARYIISCRGRPVAALVPLEPPTPEAAAGPDAWDELERLGEEIAEEWTSPMTSTELLTQMRR